MPHEHLVAEPVSESAEVRHIVRRRPDGPWDATGTDNAALVVDDDLRVLARFPAPAEVLPAEAAWDASEPGFLNLDWIPWTTVSDDRTLAAFAGYGRITVVDTAGRIRWQTEHPHAVNFDQDIQTGVVVFRPGGRLWAYVPSGERDPGTAEDFELWVVDVGGGAVVSRSQSALDSSYFTVTVGPELVGFGASDGNDAREGWWTTWNGIGEVILAAGPWWPMGTLPDGRHLVVGHHRLFVGELADLGELSYGNDDAHYYDACAVADNLVLVSLTDYGTRTTWHGVAEPDAVRGAVQYPSFEVTLNCRIASAGDGTWLTFGHRQTARRWRFAN